MSERPIDDVKFDVLRDVLETLRFRGSIFFRSELATPWGISLASTMIPRFHIALSGDCFIGSDDQDTVKVQAMEIVMLPNGNAHWIADQPGRKLINSDTASEACDLDEPLFQQGDITHCLMCGLVNYDWESPHPILDSLPGVLHITRLKRSEPVWMTVTLIEAEIRRSRDRRNPIVDRLTEVLFLQLVNRFVDENEEETGFLAALRDRHIHEALKLIHQQPAYRWTLSSLGERIGMSRTTLVRHFEDAVGVAPMRYITNWRIMKAYNLIKYTATPLEQIAESVGFASASTLNKAFKRHYNCTPNKLRQANQQLTDSS